MKIFRHQRKCREKTRKNGTTHKRNGPEKSKTPAETPTPINFSYKVVQIPETAPTPPPRPAPEKTE
ncbi:hypothetical protein E2C01_076934 [Portunus trituberculatus]|uniref:Uncharacterized protein n=1 Tax=Portunus trituberculatus TaxID=210409 RepID=A0A5B7IKY0_PORTR|nr:hypothetical protein [Portunus trituberculatus]